MYSLGWANTCLGTTSCIGTKTPTSSITQKLPHTGRQMDRIVVPGFYAILESKTTMVYGGRNHPTKTVYTKKVCDPIVFSVARQPFIHFPVYLP